jgi:hypothetical protein
MPKNNRRSRMHKLTKEQLAHDIELARTVYTKEDLGRTTHIWECTSYHEACKRAAYRDDVFSPARIASLNYEYDMWNRFAKLYADSQCTNKLTLEQLRHDVGLARAVHTKEELESTTLMLADCDSYHMICKRLALLWGAQETIDREAFYEDRWEQINKLYEEAQCTS